MKRGHALLLLLPAGGAALAVVVASATSLTVAPGSVSSFRTCALTGYPATSVAALDTYSDQDKPGAKNGTAKFILVANRSGKTKVGFLRYDLSKCAPAITSSAVIKQATLRLFITAQASTSRTYGAYPVTGPCHEGLSTCWGEDTLTYNNNPTYSSTDTDKVTIATGAANNNKYYSWNVTSDVVKIVAGTASNYGWAIADPAAYTGTAEASFTAVEDASIARAPQLVIVYSP
ncbi:MAG: DNRLRE domain-containing protein [Acidimicrobiia bacterium]